MFKRIACLILTVTMLCGSAQAEVQYMWDGAFPPLPELQHHAYRMTGEALDCDELVNALWSGREHTRSEEASSVHYQLEKKLSDSGFAEDVYGWKGEGISYIVDRTEWPAWADIGGADAAYTKAEDWLADWLPEECFAVRGFLGGSYDEDGNPVDHHYSLAWMQEIEPGVTAYEPGIRVEYYSCGVNSASIHWRVFEPKAVESREYLTAQQALASLNYAAANIDPAHTCTSFDDPQDTLVAIDAVMSDRFNEEGIYTLCWQFTIRDARKGFVRTVLVDAVSGDIFDDHDGRLDGCF